MSAGLVAPEAAVRRALDELARRHGARRYALLDAARGPQVLRCLQSDEPSQSLYEGEAGRDLATAAPYLAALEGDSLILSYWLKHGWGRAWGVLLVSDASLGELRSHFRRFLRVQLEDGPLVYFRFYDPRVLGAYLPTCTDLELEEFMGPVRAFLVESGEGAAPLVFERGRGISGR